MTVNRKAMVILLYFVLGCGAVFINHVINLNSDFDDKGVYRASSYFWLHKHDPLTENIKAHLLSLGYQGELSRISYTGNYLANNYLVGIFEKLPMISAFQGVFLAHLSMHLAAFASFFLIVLLLHGLRARIIVPVFLFSLSSFIFSASWLFPFDNKFFSPVTWITAYPRGSSTLFFFSGLICFAPASRKVPLWVRCLLGCVMICASAFCHVSTALMYVIVSAAAAVVFRFVKINIKRVCKDKEKTRKLLIITNCIVAASVVAAMCLFLCLLWIGGVKFSIGKLYASNYVRLLMLVSLFLFCLYLLASNGLIALWCRAAKGFSDDIANEQLMRFGDFCFKAFLPFMLVTLAMYPLHPTSLDSATQPVFLLYESSRRVMGMAHVLWWMVFGISLYLIAGRKHERRFDVFSLAWTALILLGMATTIYSSVKFGSPAKATLLNRTYMSECVSDINDSKRPETEIYHAIANEYRHAFQKNHL